MTCRNRFSEIVSPFYYRMTFLKIESFIEKVDVVIIYCSGPLKSDDLQKRKLIDIENKNPDNIAPIL